MKIFLLISICFNIFLLMQEDSAESEALKYKSQILKLKSEQAQDQVVTKKSSRRKKTKVSKPKILKKSSASEPANSVADQDEFEAMEMNMDLDDNSINDRLIDEFNYTQSEVFQMEEIIDQHHQKITEYFEKRKDESYKPHRYFQRESPHKKIMKETHSRLKKTLGPKKYNNYMKLLDEFNESMDQKRKAGEPYYYRII